MLNLRIPPVIASAWLGRAFVRLAVGRTFHRYFRIVPANTDALRDEVYRIRYEVYCRELGWEDSSVFSDGRECDAYDKQAFHCLLLHKPSGQYAGCVRFVRVDPNEPAAPLPFERTCEGRLFTGALDYGALNRLRIGEISRLAVRGVFRRRAGEQHVAEGVIPERYESGPRRKTPPIAMGLYLAAAASGLMSGVDGVFALMEPRLAKRLSIYGIRFRQVGEPVEHRGLRAPYYITPADLYRGIPPVVRGLLDVLMRDLRAAGGWDASSAGRRPGAWRSPSPGRPAPYA